MIKTVILLGIENSRPVWYRSTGLAKNIGFARWLFSYLGWDSQGTTFPLIADINKVLNSNEFDNPEEDTLSVPEVDTLWVLGSAVILN